MEGETTLIYNQATHLNLVYSHMLQLRNSIKIENGKRLRRSYNNDIKLLFRELNFIVSYIEYGDRPIRIVYIGSSPGFHLAKLMKLFKFNQDEMIHFDLYDDQPIHPDLKHYIDENQDQVNLYNELFTLDTCERYIDTNEDVYLISDIRDPKYSRDPIFGADKEAKEKWQTEKEESYVSDMEFQKQITIKMRPKYTCLLFRPPHFYDGITDDNASFEYFKGVVWLPIFADLKSTEACIVTNDYDNINYKWSLRTYQFRLNYYNDIVRESLLLNPLTGEQTPLPNQIGNNYESVMVFVLLIRYLQSIGIAKKSIRLKTLMDLYTDFVMVDFCSDSRSFFQNCSFNEVHSAGDGTNEQSCLYIDDSLELIN